jgi:hypothetical protein
MAKVTRVGSKEAPEELGESIAGEYSKYETTRNPFLMRARECSKYTIPTLVPPAGANAATKYITPFQGVGARGVNNIASKLLLALLPANQPFFRLDVDNKVLDELGEARGAAEEALSEIEQRVVREINSSQLRVKVFEALKHLIVSGNALVYLPPKETKLKVYPLARYVVNRDAVGNVTCIITKETVSYETLDNELKTELNFSDDRDDSEVNIYTKVEWEEDHWEVEQEIDGKTIESTKTTYPADKCPWLPLRLIVVDGEDYGRSYVEEYLGDIKSLEGLTKAIVEGSAAAAKLLIFVSPNGTTRKRTVAEANNLAIIEGNAGDVTAFKVDKGGDFSVALQTANSITERLSFAFMLNSAVQRNADRVTAEEIRYIANELEDTLGGVYSILGNEFQYPFANLMLARMQRQGKIPALPKGVVKPIVITGMEALGRQADLQKLDMFMQHLGTLGQETIAQYLVIDEAIRRIGSALQVDTKDLVRSSDEVKQAQRQSMQQQAMMQMAQSAVPNAVKGVADAANQNMAQQQGEPNGAS